MWTPWQTQTWLVLKSGGMPSNLYGMGACRQLSSSSMLKDKNYYQIMGLPQSASVKEVKMQFKKLSKKYHPDMNQDLDEDEKQKNSEKFVEIVTAYDTLKDIKKKRSYDQDMRRGGGGGGSGGFNNMAATGPRRGEEWQNKYYGEAKYYSKSGSSGRSSYTASGLNTKRHRVHRHNGMENQSSFSGEHRNYGDRHSVPHFNYDEHLHKHLKFEQRIISKKLSDSDREAIMAQLKSSNGKNISEELITKHLMRQASQLRKSMPASRPSASSSYGATSHNPHMYQSPQQDDNGLKITFAVIGASSSLYLLYHLVSG
ncbi:Piso0_004077 [Millerozyma farinosa CBS 7064]|uniref:Piso0_004077 protein n=1 Tax=Pichia sorbitophila (strain ATCC MYA-4447 / BCRC 22081 / CBS 7064 / NBRC 10061 / NRRL Y-12695) TaxID=559304 RepID=G8YAB8_PICSO|nr:Piso0_004077 [Millerozyma farinosa CBS 7064]CCE84532.1 Piso0_004077 [Millerozyma farinosa CBS 7064]